MRPLLRWNLARRSLQLGERTLVMGVVNVTPDSFSDGGRYLNVDAAIAHGLHMLDEGADILDIGGESTRPGTAVDSGLSPNRQAAVGPQQELDRVLPVLKGLRARADAILSIDTYKSAVARAALDAGAEIVNDVSGLTWDAEMASMIATRGCGLILMHTRGVPAEWRELPPLLDPASVVIDELRSRADQAVRAGIRREAIVLDPGFGFGKRLDENYPLLARLDELQSLGFPLAVGISRKRFLTETVASRLAQLGRLQAATSSPQSLSQEQQDTATLAATVAAALAGVHIVRVHAVRPAVEALAIADAILQFQR